MWQVTAKEFAIISIYYCQNNRLAIEGKSAKNA